MHRRQALAAALGAVLVAGIGGPAQAAPKPLRGGYTAGPTVPDPTTGGLPFDTCEGLPTAEHRRTLSLPSRGVLRVELASTGDWGLVVRDARGRALARSDTALATGTERATVRLRGPAKVLIEACNFAGAPTAQVSWTLSR